jgi:hypothetical protein
MNISRNFTPHQETRSGPRSRESTAPLEDDTHDYTSFPRLHLTFNPGPRGSRGLEFGTNPNCDIVLPRLEHISRVHCALTFDNQRRLILRNLSSNGTIVEYNVKGVSGSPRMMRIHIGTMTMSIDSFNRRRKITNSLSVSSASRAWTQLQLLVEQRPLATTPSVSSKRRWEGAPLQL